MNVLVVGVATLDIINLVDAYPAEDEKIRVSGQWRQIGGNAANTARVLQQLGHRSYWAGVMAVDDEATLIRRSLQNAKVNCSHAVVEASGVSPVSYITLNRMNGSRTILHHRDLREFTAEDFAGIDLKPFSWVHFEGRQVDELQQMLRQLPVCCSLEVEKPREGIETLFRLPQLLLFSKDYAQGCGYDNAEQFLYHVKPQCREGAVLVCAWGEQGAWAIDGKGGLYHAPAYIPGEVVDTVGAGDVFNAGMIGALLSGETIGSALHQACRLAGRKCGQQGIDNLSANRP
ncbi:MAG: PfkB family carbohydrate kinase [Chromatiales bacterium]|nr:PfkB family carbohydrate kinase [Chromatiales bacterium]